MNGSLSFRCVARSDGYFTDGCVAARTADDRLARFMLLKGVTTHFQEPTGEPIAIANTVHLFNDHIRTGRTAGLVLLELREQLVDEEWVGTNQRPFWRAGPGKPFGPYDELHAPSHIRGRTYCRETLI